MKNKLIKTAITGIFAFCLMAFTRLEIAKENQKQIPHLKKQGTATQLIVHDQPFIILGGELGNSSFTSLAYMQAIWPKLQAMQLNTILAPVYWELIEPVKNQFDFALFDQLLAEARIHDFKLVLLWFGSWKNSMSSHAPAWVKKDQVRFPRAKDEQGNSQEILSPFSENNLQADLRAYQALLQHLKEIDGDENTVIMVQTENEIGMLPSARDYHPAANQKFQENVPAEMMRYLVQNKDQLVPEFRQVWSAQGRKTSGNWEAVFGKGLHTDELFMAWYFAKFTNQVVAAGKSVYPFPMFVNAALNRPGKLPGAYPSAGPLPHLMDIWKAAGPDIDFLSPDFYNPDFSHWCDLYTRQQNPLFVPEHRFDETAAAKAIFSIGHYQSLGFSPFSIESTKDAEQDPLGKMYALIEQLSPLISARQGQGKIDGVLLDKEKQETVFSLGDYTFTVRHSHTLGWEANAKNDTWQMAGAILIQTAADEFYLAGSGVVATVKHRTDPAVNVGILKTEEGQFENGNWQIIRHLNGDQTHQGRHFRIFADEYAIQRFELYRYD